MSTSSAAAVRSNRLLARFLLYGGAGLWSMLVNPALFALFHEVLGWNNYAAYALSLSLLNVLQFLWNYYIGFRPTEHWTTSARRQLVILCVANALNYALVVTLQAVFVDWKKLVILAVQGAVALAKFIVYHFWVYPFDESRLKKT